MSKERDALDRRKELFDSSESNYIEIDGEEYYSSIIDFYETVHIFLKEYGLGGCRDITEFAEMMNNEDPQLVEGLLYVIMDNRQREVESYEDKKFNKSTHNPRSNKFKGRVPVPDEFISKKDPGKGNINPNMMKSFLINVCHVPLAKVNEGIAKIKSGEIQILDEYINVSKEDLYDPEFDWKVIAKKMRKIKEKSINFKVTGEDILGKH